MMSMLLAVALTGAADVQLRQHDGTRIAGTLIALSDDLITLRSNEQTLQIPITRIRRIQLGSSDVPGKSKQLIRVKLRNGSTIQSTQYAVKENTATLRLKSGLQIKLPTKGIDHVILLASTPALDRERGEIFGGKRPGDIVTIRRKGNNLDYVDGVLADITDDKVRFKFDNEWIDVRRAKVDAIQYHSPGAPVAMKARCKLVSDDASTWHVRQLSVKDGNAELVLGDQLRVSLPLEHVRTIDFASSETVFLSDLKPESVHRTPSIRISALTEDLDDLGADEPFTPRGDHAFSGRDDPLRLTQPDGTSQQFTKGLAIHSRTELTYRLAGEYREFRALAGLDPAVGNSGSVILELRTDTKELLRREIRGGMSPADVAVDVTGAKRLTVLVDYSDAADIADRLNLCEARLIK